MQKLINGDLVEVIIVYKNNKNIYLRFQNDGKLVATCNRFVKEKDIEKLIDNNIIKISKMYEAYKKQKNEELYWNYLGKQYTIVYDNENIIPYFNDNLIFIKNQKTLDKFLEEETKRIFNIELERIVPNFVNIPKFSLKIRKMKTRWGVCNRSNNTITLNSELIKKDLDLLDYVIIHELCHFYYANHSKLFWDCVAKYYPDYKGARKGLRS